MISCFFVRRKLYEYIDESLSEEARVKVADHLDRCPRCRRQVQGIRSVLSMAAAHKAPVPSEDFWKRFRAELDDKLNRKLVPDAQSAALRMRLRPALALAAVCLLVLSFTFLLQGSRSPSPVRLVQEVELKKEDVALVEELGSWEEVDPGFIQDTVETSAEELS